MKLTDFIKRHKHLVWWTTNYDKLSEEAIVEATLNYGTWQDVQTLIKILGIKKVAAIFRRKSRQTRSNYRPKTEHFFTIYFNRHA